MSASAFAHLRLWKRQNRENLVPWVWIWVTTAWMIPPRFLALQRDFWFDEITNNLLVLSTPNFFTLRKEIFFQYQPLLDYCLRKFFWFPVFGHHELGLRISSLVYSILTVAALGTIGYSFFRQKLGPLFAFLVAEILTVWGGSHSSEIYYAAEARGYSLVSLVSVLWFCTFIKRDADCSNRKNNLVFGFLSAVFINVHFFAIPCVLSAYAYECFFLIRKKAIKRGVTHFVTGMGIFLFTVFINFPALQNLIVSPPTKTSVSSTENHVTPLAEIGKLLFRFIEFLHLPLFFTGFWLIAALLLNLFSTNREHRIQGIRLGFIGFFGVISVFLVSILSSDYKFYDRYFIPFFGIAPVVLLLTVQGLSDLYDRLGGARSIRLQFASLTLLACLLEGQFYQAIQIEGEWLLPAQDFSPTYSFFRDLKALHFPVAVLPTNSWATKTVSFYWEHMTGNVPGERLRFIPVIDPRNTRAVKAVFEPRVESELKLFLSENTNPVILLFGAWNKSCRAPLHSKDLPATLSVSSQYVARQCIWKIQNATNLKAIQAAAWAIGV